ncbi:MULTISPECIES: DUF1810 domain-containing protein [unclassified Thiocapsa]|uniref:DUF1810 domain-containing protein n=1 Tax=unclassified Thiocapsa TaxID=2641286 RepID=UPI0035B180C7
MSRLDRFLQAQEMSYDSALTELKQGLKVGHWMWYIFPQIRGLGFSLKSQHYAIEDLEEARAYLSHPVLGPRLMACTEAVNAIDGKSLYEIFADPDNLKFCSCMTLFARASTEQSVFHFALQKYCHGQMDHRTLSQLGEKEN